MKKTMSFRSPEEAFQYLVDRMEKENRELSLHLIAMDTLMQFLIRATEVVHPDIREGLLTMIDHWHKGCLQRVEHDMIHKDLRSAFDELAAQMTKMVEPESDEPPSFEVIRGGKDDT